MAIIRPFRALRPAPAAAAAVAAVPYDVVSTREARRLVADNPLSFLHVSRAEIDLPDSADPYGQAVYERAARNLKALAERAPLVVDPEPALYLYRMQAGGHEQIGLAGCFSLDEYDRDVIKRHERTRRDKEDDRTRHMVALRAQTGIVFLAYRATARLDDAVDEGAAEAPLLDVAAPDGVRHSVWRLSPEATRAAAGAFADVPAVYIADGHHRIASAARARDALAGGDPQHEACFFLGVAFPDRQTRILPYNRTVADLASRTAAEFLDALRARFPVAAAGPPVPPKGRIAMYLEGAWYTIEPAGVGAAGGTGAPAARLDAAILQDRILAPLLDVADIRTDPRVGFVGGARGVAALEQAVDSGAAAVAFSLAAVTPDELLAVSDAGGIMPPKSTWFEPKLRDGLLIHTI
ncbi:MAG: DUF1015 domain-containing protein [Acidobacteria bacterium]|nr:DUF1015 domain-containing protein [Acidobacteriota bacterium]